jgi:hypothetical protein
MFSASVSTPGGTGNNIMLFGGNALTLTPNTIRLASSGAIFTNLYAASTNTVVGDTIYVGSGTYFEGNHVCTFQKSVTVVPLGRAILYLSLTNTVPVVDSDHIYIKPTDNLKIKPGLILYETTINKFNAFVGTATNTPGATNFSIYLECYNADSDGMYNCSTNVIIGEFILHEMHGYWDVLADTLDLNPNSIITVSDFNLAVDHDNGLSAANYRSANIQSRATYIFKNGVFRSNRTNFISYGVNVTATPTVILNNVGFDLKNNTYADLNLNSGNISMSGCYRLDGSPLIIINNGANIVSTPIQSGMNVPASKLYFDADTFIGGGWFFQHGDDYGDIVITNHDNIVSSFPSWIHVQPNNDSFNEPGMINFQNLSVVLGEMSLFQPIVTNQDVTIWNSNRVLYLVTSNKVTLLKDAR